jgi:hypothetical protein
MMRIFHLLRAALLVVTVGALLTGRPVLAEILVHFDQDVYYVNGPGDTVDAMILLDADAATEGDDPLAEGLFSFGVATTFNGIKAQVSSDSDISAAAELDFFGFASGAFASVTPGFAGVKGNIDQTANPLIPYGAPLLAKIQFTNLASAADSYPLQLDFFETLGVNEQLFIDGAGTVLDDQIRFRSARVVVVPEPTSYALLMVAMLVFMCRARPPMFKLRMLSSSVSIRVIRGSSWDVVYNLSCKILTRLRVVLVFRATWRCRAASACHLCVP